jgi:iron complex outermembrane receptor protein
MKRTSKTIVYPALAALVVAAHASSASGQNSSNPAPDTRLEEIVVTAEKMGLAELQKTPAAISVFTSEQLDKDKIVNIQDLVQYAPSMQMSQLNASPQIFIRGIGTAYVATGGDPDVTMQIDGVYLGHAFNQFLDFIDVDRIEVLRGPQGTLYGRNAVGGTINVITKLPTDEFQAKEQLTVGNYSLVEDQAYVSGALVPGKVQASLAAHYIRHDPYVENIVPGQHGVGDANRGGLRGTLRMEPSAHIEAITRFDWAESNENEDGYTHILAPVPGAPLASSLVGNFTKVALNTPQPIKTRNKGVAEEINVKLTDALNFKSISAYREGAFNLTIDPDATELLADVATNYESTKQFTQEVNLTGNFQRFRGILGAFYFQDQDTSYYTILMAPPPVPLLEVTAPVANAMSWAVFGEGTYHLTSDLSATVGARYTVDEKKVNADLFANIAVAFPSTAPLGPSISLPGFPLPFVEHTVRRYGALTPKFALNWQATPNIMLYASATNGFKSGGTNLTALALSALNYGPEKIWSYEGGAKSQWFDDRLRVNLDAFRYDYRGLQVLSVQGSGVVINNAARATVNGFEAEITAKPARNLLFAATASLLDARYGQFPNSSVPPAALNYIRVLPCYVPPSGPGFAYCNAAGKRLNNAPASSFTISGEYTYGLSFGSLFARAEQYWTSRVYFDPSNVAILSQAPYGITNLSVGYDSTDGKREIAIIGSNIFDTHYFIAVAANGLVPDGLPGAPASIGIRATVHF